MALLVWHLSFIPLKFDYYLASQNLVDTRTKASFEIVNGHKGNFEQQELHRLVYIYIYFVFLSQIFSHLQPICKVSYIKPWLFGIIKHDSKTVKI